MVERRCFYRDGQRYSNRYQFRQSREAGTSGLPNCLRIMLQPERSSGFKKFSYFVMLFCFLIFLLFILVLSFLCFIFTQSAVSCNGTDILVILFLCSNHDISILVLACCCSPNITSALRELQLFCTQLKKETAITTTTTIM